MGESLICKQESGNPNDPYAVAIRKGSEVVGHVPKEIICSLFINVCPPALLKLDEKLTFTK